MRSLICIALLWMAAVHPYATARTPLLPERTAGTGTQTEEQFPYPEIPMTLRTPEVRKDYLLRNYWSAFDFYDTTLLNNKEVAEQGFVNFIALLADNGTSEELERASMADFCKRMTASAEAKKVFIPMSKNYLFHADSPMYNEALYACFLHEMLHFTKPGDAERMRIEFLLKLIERNRPGEAATDFTFYTPDGKGHSLKNYTHKGNRLLLLFYDPECTQCHKTLEKMKADTWLAAAIKAGTLDVLAIYTEGDEKIWRDALPQMPHEWMTGNDRSQIKDKSLYDLKAMPAIYLLDKQKRVMLKDATYDKVKSTLTR